MVRTYRPGTATCYRLRDAAHRLAKETRRRTAPGLKGLGKLLGAGSRRCGGEGCLKEPAPRDFGRSAETSSLLGSAGSTFRVEKLRAADADAR